MYFVHNLNDPAVARRVAMFRMAGLAVLLVGFWRDHPPAEEIAGAETLALGETFDAAFAHRALSAMRHSAFPGGRLRREIGSSDVLVARNLEMLAIAVSAAVRKVAPAIVYEVLDIHRLMLSRAMAGRTLRALERALLKNVALVITSSPAFAREYFAPYQHWSGDPPISLIENKSLVLDERVAEALGPEIAPGPPWRIGWFGMIRCRRSLAVLAGLAARRPDLLELQIRGRLTREVASDLEKLDTGKAAYQGPYRPDELARIYRNVHLNWAIDYFEDEGNSRWLLPNRVYEGGRFQSVPLARRETETAQWLSARGLGVNLLDPEHELEPFLENLTSSRFRTLKDAARAAPRADFVADEGDCERLGRLLASAVSAGRHERSVRSDVARLGSPN